MRSGVLEMKTEFAGRNGEVVLQGDGKVKAWR